MSSATGATSRPDIYAPPEDGRGNPLDGLRRAADFFADLSAVEARRHGAAADVLLRDPEAERYPRYYRRMFHFQSDGYLSEASAERYDYQVEVLFGGGASLMRRQALVPLRAALRRHPGGVWRTARLLDIGCGTGSFLREVKRNFPRLAVTGLDLSEPYLALAESPAGRLVASDADSRRGGGDAVRGRRIRNRQLHISVP